MGGLCGHPPFNITAVNDVLYIALDNLGEPLPIILGVVERDVHFSLHARTYPTTNAGRYTQDAIHIGVSAVI